MGNLAEALKDMAEAAEADFGYPEHAPQWLTAGTARVCTVCGVVDLSAADRSPEPGIRSGRTLPTGVVSGGGPAIGAEAEEFYRQEKWS